MNRKWLVGGVAGALALAAVLALIVGGVVGRSIVPSPASTPQPADTPPRPVTVRFSDNLSDVAISYPAVWTRRQSTDSTVRLVAAAPDESAALSLSVRRSGLDTAVTERTLPVVRPLTDDLLRADRRIASLAVPDAVRVGNLPGYRYQYTYRTSDGTQGAHVHYFLFDRKRLIQIVFQAVPASGLGTLQPTFERIAGTFQLIGKP